MSTKAERRPYLLVDCGGVIHMIPARTIDWTPETRPRWISDSTVVDVASLDALVAAAQAALMGTE